MSILDDIPKPVLYGGGALLLIVAFLFSRRGGSGGGEAGVIGSTLASMQLAASTNIQALEITSRRDVALAGEHTKRYQAAYGINAMREANALNFVTEKMVGKNTIELAHLEHASIQREMDQHYAHANLREENAQINAARTFGLAKAQQAQDFNLASKRLELDRTLGIGYLDLDKMALKKKFDAMLREMNQHYSLANLREKNTLALTKTQQAQDFSMKSKYFELDRTLGIGYLDLDKITQEKNYELAKAQQKFDFLENRRAMRFGYPIMMRRYDLQEHQANLGAGVSFMGAVPGLVDAGLSVYDRLGTAGKAATGALSGAATGAAVGSVVPGIGTALGAGVGAAAGGGGGLS